MARLDLAVLEINSSIIYKLSKRILKSYEQAYGILT